jgi:hypothetical protein
MQALELLAGINRARPMARRFSKLGLRAVSLSAPRITTVWKPRGLREVEKAIITLAVLDDEKTGRDPSRATRKSRSELDVAGGIGLF